MIRHQTCERCGRETRQEISCRIAANGAAHYGWWCHECQKWSRSKLGGIWITKSFLVGAGVDLATVPVIERAYQPRCSRCGARGAEIHHWGPKGVFGEHEAEAWPKDYLCRPCHERWHLIVTPQLVRKEF